MGWFKSITKAFSSAASAVGGVASGAFSDLIGGSKSSRSDAAVSLLSPASSVESKAKDATRKRRGLGGFAANLLAGAEDRSAGTIGNLFFNLLGK